MEIKGPEYRIGEKIFDTRDNDGEIYTINGMSYVQWDNLPVGVKIVGAAQASFQWVYTVAENTDKKIPEYNVVMATTQEIQAREIKHLKAQLNDKIFEVKELNKLIDKLTKENKSLTTRLGEPNTVEKLTKENDELSNGVKVVKQVIETKT